METYAVVIIVIVVLLLLFFTVRELSPSGKAINSYPQNVPRQIGGGGCGR